MTTICVNTSFHFQESPRVRMLREWIQHDFTDDCVSPPSTSGFWSPENKIWRSCLTMICYMEADQVDESWGSLGGRGALRFLSINNWLNLTVLCDIVFPLGYHSRLNLQSPHPSFLELSHLFPSLPQCAVKTLSHRRVGIVYNSAVSTLATVDFQRSCTILGLNDYSSFCPHCFSFVSRLFFRSQFSLTLLFIPLNHWPALCDQARRQRCLVLAMSLSLVW